MPSQIDTRSVASGRWLVAPALLVVLAGIVAQFFYLPNDDATWLMVVVRRLALGGTLYSADLVEINPPLIVWLTALAVNAGELLHVESVTAWRLLVGAQALCSIWLSAALLPRLVAGDVDLRPHFLTFLAWVYACMPGYDYGQREHFIVLWMTPYLLLASQRAVGMAAPRGHEIIAGVLVGATLCLKPHYAIAIGLVELGVALERRTLRAILDTTTLVAASCFAAYALVLTWRYPAYFSFATPLALRYYPAYGALQVRWVHLAYLLAGLAAAALTRSPALTAASCRLFVLAATGAFVAFVLQRKGWPYHFMPAKTFFGLAVVISLASGVTSWIGRRREAGSPAVIGPSLAVASVAVAVALAGAWSVREVQHFYATRNARVVQNVAQYLAAVDLGGAPRRFAAFSLSLFPAFPVNELIRGEWSSRFSCMWILPGIVDAERAGEAPPLSGGAAGREYLEGAVCEDFERWRPELVLVETSRQMSVLSELLKSERFRAIWSEYQVVGDVEYFRVFQRVRTAAPADVPSSR